MTKPPGAARIRELCSYADCQAGEIFFSADPAQLRLAKRLTETAEWLKANASEIARLLATADSNKP